MYFLETIEGTKGEKFTSAILKYLFINSDGFRRLFLDRIQTHFAASNTLSFKNGVICRTEVATDKRDGFVDLVLIGDNAVLGIENKIWAEIQHDQPKKYVGKLRSLARDHCRNADSFKVVMLAPAERTDDVNRELRSQGIDSTTSIVMDWQSLMKDLKMLAQIESGEVQSVARAFHEYLAHRISDVRINASPEHLLGDVLLGNAFHEDFLYKVWRVFDNGGRIVGGGKTGDAKWYGMSFGLPGKRLAASGRPWFGFYTEGNEVSLVVQTRLAEFSVPSEAFARSQYSKHGDLWLDVGLNQEDDSVQKWSTKLGPLFDEFRNRLADDLAESDEC